jgi:hypothetical protein
MPLDALAAAFFQMIATLASRESLCSALQKPTLPAIVLLEAPPFLTRQCDRMPARSNLFGAFGPLTIILPQLRQHNQTP